MAAASFPQMVLEPDAPTAETFIRERHWSRPPPADAALAAATERRLGIVIPPVLAAAWRVRNGGRTDFIYAARAPGAPLDPPEADFDRLWREAVPDGMLLPMAEWDAMTAIQAGMDHDPDHGWAEHLPHADRLVCIGRYVWDAYLCLDHAAGPADPAVVLFDDTRWRPGDPEPFEARWESVGAFLAALRRPVLVEHEGRRWRGIMPVDGPEAE